MDLKGIFDNGSVEKVCDQLLHYLEWNDVLRLRRVCKVSKIKADEFIRKKGILPNSEVEIDGTTKKISDFLKLEFPIARIYLNNSITGSQFFEQKDFKSFVKKCSGDITHLRVFQISRCLQFNEVQLFTSLSSMTHLEVNKICDVMDRSSEDLLKESKKCGLPSEDMDCWLINILSRLNKLTSFKIWTQTDSKLELGYMANLVMGAVKELRQVEHLGLPSSLLQFDLENKKKHFDYFDEVIDAIIDRSVKAEQVPGEFKKLCTVEFLGFSYAYTGGWDDVMYTTGRVVAVLNFLTLAKECVSNGVTLKNVNAALFHNFGATAKDLPLAHKQLVSAVGHNVHSLVNVDSSILLMEMPNLEKLIIDKVSHSSIFLDWKRRPVWPNLKILHVNSDCRTLLPVPSSTGTIYVITLQNFFKFLFTDISRPSLAELHLGWKPDMSANDTESSLPSSIVTSCPNLRKLSLTNWHGSNDPLITLWNGLPALEEVCLDSCENVGTVTFVGANGKDPVFLKLKNLKKLTLKGLEKMPKITDLAFTLVFRHMKLKELHLKSDQPLKKITVEGIRSLLSGEFAAYVERFPFTDFQLSRSVSPLKEVKKVEALFRSSHMI